MSDEQNSLTAIQANRAVSEVQGQIFMARQFPRDIELCRRRLAKECSRINLAEQALYSYPRGGTTVTGPSIRLAEAAMRSFGNMAAGIIEVERREGESSLIAYSWDFESNVRHEIQFRVAHVRDTKKGGKQEVSDERDIYEIAANNGARRKRACILAIIPGDLIDEAVATCKLTLSDSIKDLDKTKKQMFAGFMKFGVTVQMIEKRLGHRQESVRPEEIITLRAVYNSIKEGMAPASQYFDFEKAPEDIVKPAAQTQAQPSEQTPAKKTGKTQAQEPGKKTGTEQPAAQSGGKTPPKKPEQQSLLPAEGYDQAVQKLVGLMSLEAMPDDRIGEIKAVLEAGETNPGVLSALADRIEREYFGTPEGGEAE